MLLRVVPGNGYYSKEFSVLFLLVVGLTCVLLILLGTRRHQETHCAHLHDLSDALAALSTFISDRVPGELPEDVRTFVEEWKAQDSESSDDGPERERL